MGNVCHKGPARRGDAGSARMDALPAPEKASAPAFGRDPTLKREDFVFSRVAGPARLTKPPGSVNGQQFLVEECRDCDLLVLDHCASVQIDECVRCRIVIGPCQGSLFLRNCADCTIVCAVQQFRSRDCKGCDVYLYSATEPIIETSAKMRFGCFPLTYASLQQQIERVNFSVWNNCWSEIYNFTPDQGAWKSIQSAPRDTLLASGEQEQGGGSVALWKMLSETAESLGITTDMKHLVVPLSSGITARREDEASIIVCFLLPSQARMMEFVKEMQSAARDAVSDVPAVVLIRTRQLKLTPKQVESLFQDKICLRKLAPIAAQASKTTAGSVVMEFQGPACAARATEILASSAFAELEQQVFLSPDATTAKSMANLIFTRWRPSAFDQ